MCGTKKRKTKKTERQRMRISNKKIIIKLKKEIECCMNDVNEKINLKHKNDAK